MALFLSFVAVALAWTAIYWWYRYDEAQSEVAIRKEYIEYLHEQLDSNARMVAQLDRLEYTMSELETRSITTIEFSDN